MRSVVKPIAGLCLLLIVVSAFAFAAHQHSSSLDETKCTVCVVAHSASPSATCSLPTGTFVLAQLVVLAQPVSAKQRLVPFALTVRPPPTI